ncbi:MAG: hypothetical protein PHW46_03575, partial [Candidatus Omnitrophica bacterium]|nr:hypothetical protein [Candidatus Omnitrophota bacterium]
MCEKFITNIKDAKITKVTALAVCSVFLFQQILLAEGAEKIPQAGFLHNGTQGKEIFPESIDFPAGIARKYGAYKGENGDLVINVQDAHGSLSAQHSIVDMLELLSKDYDLEFVSVEGAAGYIDTSLLRTCPDKKIRRGTADFLMSKGIMNAGEFFTITNDEKEILLYGAEDDKLYQKNLNVFRQVFEIGEALIPGLETEIAAVEKQNDAVFNEKLKRFNDKTKAHREGTLGFREYWAGILDHGIAKAQDDNTQLNILSRVIELERKIDFDKANKERETLVGMLMDNLKKEELKEFILKCVTFKEKKISPAFFHSFLINLAEGKGIDTKALASLHKFSKYRTMYEAIDIFRAQEEMEVAEELIAEKLCQSDREKELLALEKILYLIKRTLSIQASNREIRILKERINQYTPDYINDLVQNKALTTGKEIEKSISGAKEALGFYEDAEKRNNAMINNTLRLMRKEHKKVAALISGGYHSEGLAELLRKNKVSYLVVSPQFEEGKERPYITILTGKKDLYDQIKNLKEYKISSSGCFYAAQGDLTKLGDGLYFALASARLKGEEALKVLKNEWISAYEIAYLNATNNKERMQEMGFCPVNPKEFKKRMQDDLDVIKKGTKVFVLLNGEAVFAAQELNGREVVQINIPEEEKKRIKDKSGINKGAVDKEAPYQRQSRDLQEQGLLYRVYGEKIPQNLLEEIAPFVKKEKEEQPSHVPSYLHALFLAQHIDGARIVGTRDARNKSEKIKFPPNASFLTGSLYQYQSSSWLTYMQFGGLHVAVHPSAYKRNEKTDPDCILFVETTWEGLEKTLMRYMGGTSWKPFDEWFSFAKVTDKDEEKLISRFVKYVPTRSRVDDKKGIRVFTNVEPNELKDFVIKRRWMGPRMPHSDDTLYEDVELFVMSVTGRALPRYFGPFTGVLSELESNAKIRGKGLSDWQMFLYECKDKEGQTRWFFRYRLFQDGISETNERGITHPLDHWSRLAINAISAARFKAKHLFLQGVENKERGDIPVVRKLGK